MRRIVFNTAAVLSGLLCLFFIYACLRSFLPTHVRVESIDGSLTFLFWEGAMDDNQADEYNPGSEKFAGARTILKSMSRQVDHQILGFRYVRGGGLFRGVTYQIYFVPYWIIIPLTAILPILCLRRCRRERFRTKEGHCMSCGYDLRESKEKCPECGAAIKAAMS